jgi:hypothetical protein
MQDREGFSRMIQFIRSHPGEAITLYVFEISRLGRSFLDTPNMVRTLEESGTRVWLLSPAEFWSRIDDKKLRDLMLSIFSWVADRERENLIERTKLGIARAKAEGVTLAIPWKRVKSSRRKKSPLRQFPGSWISRIQPCIGIIRKGKQRRKPKNSEIIFCPVLFSGKGVIWKNMAEIRIISSEICRHFQKIQNLCSGYPGFFWQLGVRCSLSFWRFC